MSSKAQTTTVKLRRGGDQFEVLCKPETVMLYRAGKLGLDKVLVAEEIFNNAAKFQKVKNNDLKRAFDTEDKLACIRVILAEGDCPLTKNEMNQEVETRRREILKYLVAYYFDPRVNPAIPHPTTRFEQALETMRYSVKHNVSVEQQIKEIVKKLPEIVPVKPMDPPHLVRQEAAMADAKAAVLAKEGVRERRGGGKDRRLDD